MTSDLPQTPVSAQDPRPELIVLDEYIPGTRRVGTFVFVLVFIARDGERARRSETLGYLRRRSAGG